MNTFIKTGKMILNAMAFANAGNMNEFRSMLQENNGQQSCQGNQQAGTQDADVKAALVGHLHQAA